MTITGTTPPSPDTGLVPTFPFSMFDPVHLGVDENGEHVYVNLAERNMLLGGEPGAGKSSGLNLITAHGALSHDCKLILVDGKQVELGLWRALRRRLHRPVHQGRHRRVRGLPGHHEHPLRRPARRRPPQDHPRLRRARLPHRHRRVRLLLRHRRHQARPRGLRRADPRPGRPRPRRRRDHHPGHPAALPPGHRPVHAGPVRLPVGVPVHHRLQLRCGPRRRAGPPRATPPPTSTPWPGASAGCCPKPASPAGSRPPTSTTTTSSYLAAYAAHLRDRAAA